jgi:L-lactate dehydrogenase
MKIGIVGSGLVGSTAAYALVMRGIGREIVLIDLDEKRSRAEAADILHAVPFAHPMEVSSGDYSSLKDSRVVIISAGVSQKPGETRLNLLERNAKVFLQVISQVLTHAPEAILLIASNPVDVMTHVAAHIAKQRGVDPNRIIGSGTTLDTARFRALLGYKLGIDPQHVHAYVLGEHGDSEVLTWSLVTVGGIPLEEFCREHDYSLCPDDHAEIDKQVRNAAYQIIDGKGATYYGVGSALTRIVEVILKEQRSVLTVCTPLDDAFGVQDVTFSLPNLIGEAGIVSTFYPPINKQETMALNRSAQIIHDAIEELNLAQLL